MLAKIQQSLQEKFGSRLTRNSWGGRPAWSGNIKGENKPAILGPTMTKERQLRDFCRANNLCFFCKEPYDAAHAGKCTKRPKAQANALALNDLDVVLAKEVLEQLELEDNLTQQFCSLSLNAIAGTDVGEAMRLRARVKNKAMLLLVDSGSSHSFVSSAFLQQVGITPIPAAPKQVKVANGDVLITDKLVPGLEWLVQGHTFSSDMRVLDLPAYDAILGYDCKQSYHTSLGYENNGVHAQREQSAVEGSDC